MAQQSIEYGQRSGGRQDLIYAFPVGASEVFKKKGGGFVSDDGSGRVEIAGASATNIIGHAMINADFTASSTEGGDVVPVNMDLNAVYELPIDSGTWADTMRGETCDLAVTSDIQGVDLTASSTDVVRLIDKGTTNAAGTVVSVLVQLNVEALTQTAAV